MTHPFRTCLRAFAVIVAIGLAPASSYGDTIFTTAVNLKQPRKKPPRQGGPLDKVEHALWLPEDITVVRGAVVNPFYLKAVEQKHWRAAARQWGFGIVAANYFGVKPDDFTALRRAMKDFAKQSGHNELEHVPFCFVGMSAGAGMSVRLTELMPERTIAAAPVCLEVGPRSAASRDVPILTIFGEKDGRQMEKLRAKLPVERKEGAQWAIAVQWRRRHKFGQANNLAMVFFDQAISLRYPNNAGPLTAPVKLKRLDPKTGWIGDLSSWTTQNPKVVSCKDGSIDEQQACWLPNRYVASTWRAFVSQNPIVKIKSPAGLGDGQPFTVHASGKPLTIEITTKRKELKRIDFYDGDVKLGEATGKARMLTVAKMKAGIHALYVVATTVEGEVIVSRPATIVVD